MQKEHPTIHPSILSSQQAQQIFHHPLIPLDYRASFLVHLGAAWHVSAQRGTPLKVRNSKYGLACILLTLPPVQN